MNKPLIRLENNPIRDLETIPEAGMGYYVAEGSLEGEGNQFFVVTEAVDGEFFAIPMKHPKFFSYEDFNLLELSAEKVRLPWVENLVENVEPHTVAFNTSSHLSNFSLNTGYIPAVGAVPLLAMDTLTQTTNFYRYLRSPIDFRFDTQKQELSAGTYLTTVSDQAYANTGFAAVGRYALPIPVPAIHVFLYQLPPGTTLRVGTALPNFGQAGGGVEVQLTSATSVSSTKMTSIPAY